MQSAREKKNHATKPALCFKSKGVSPLSAGLRPLLAGDLIGGNAWRAERGNRRLSGSLHSVAVIILRRQSIVLRHHKSINDVIYAWLTWYHSDVIFDKFKDMAGVIYILILNLELSPPTSCSNQDISHS